MRKVLTRCAAVLAFVPLGAVAEDEEKPDLEFLEYLGSWQEEDEEWFVESEIAEQEQKRRAKRKREQDEDL